MLAARAAVCTTLSAAVGGATTMFVDHFMQRQLEPRRINNGILCGLVSISGSAGLIEPHFAVIIGAIASVCYVASSKMLLIFRIDDVVDSVPIHLVGGIWGLLAPALFVSRRSYVQMYGYPDEAGPETWGVGSRVLGRRV